MSKLTIDEKIEIIKKRFAYTDGGCPISCLCRAPESMVRNVVSALEEQVGLSAEEVDWYTDPENPAGVRSPIETMEGTDLKNNQLGGCGVIDDFLKCIRKILEEKEALTKGS